MQSRSMEGRQLSHFPAQLDPRLLLLQVGGTQLFVARLHNRNLLTNQRLPLLALLPKMPVDEHPCDGYRNETGQDHFSETHRRIGQTHQAGRGQTGTHTPKRPG